MKQSYLKFFGIFTKTLVMAAYIATLFFGFGLLQASATSCSYTVNFNATNGGSNLTSSNGKVTLTTQVTISGNTTDGLGDTSSCQTAFPKVAIHYYVSSNPNGGISLYGVNSISNDIILDFSNGVAQDQRDFYLNNVFTADGRSKSEGVPVPFPVSAYFSVKVYEYDTISSPFGTNSSVGSMVTGSSLVPIFIAGPVNTSSPQVTISPRTSTISPGTNVTVNASGLPAGSTLKVYINNQLNNSVPADSSGNAAINVKVDSSLPGINATGNNTLSFGAVDSNSSPISVSGSPLQFTLGNSVSGGGNLGGGGGTGSQVNCTDTPNANNCLYNPISGATDILSFLLKMIQFALGFIGTLAVLFVIIGGFRMVLAQGNEEAYGVAKKTVTWAILGLVIAVLSFSIVTIVSNVLKTNVQQVNTQNGSGQ